MLGNGPPSGGRSGPGRNAPSPQAVRCSGTSRTPMVGPTIAIRPSAVVEITAMSRLKADPDAVVGSLAELFALASALATMAGSRYAAVSVRLREAGSASHADVFESLSAGQTSYRDDLLTRAHRIGDRPDQTRMLRPLPAIFDDEGAMTSAPALLTPYRALAMAVRNDERAFAFWSYIAAHANASDVQKEAEALAREVLMRASVLRGQRRTAFHKQRIAHPPSGTESQPVAEFSALELRLAELLERHASHADVDGRIQLLEDAVQGRRHAQLLDSLPAFSSPPSPVVRVPDDPVALAELLAERYLEAADMMLDEQAMATAQTLAGAAISRLARVKLHVPNASEAPAGAIPLKR